MSAARRDQIAGVVNAAMDEWDRAEPGTLAASMAGHVADRLLAELAAAGLVGEPEQPKCTFPLCVCDNAARCLAAAETPDEQR